ncbi:MAG: phosphotransferase [Planctomycetota bacterium]
MTTPARQPGGSVERAQASPISEDPGATVSGDPANDRVASNDETVHAGLVFPGGAADHGAESAGREGPGRSRGQIEGHERFATGELAMACSHYELGVITSVREFRRGSRRSPKAVLETSRGRVLVKRRPPGPSDQPQQIAFSHAVQEHLREKSFPLARLLRTREGRGCAAIGGRSYELFEFLSGTRYDRSEGETADAGRTLAYFHRLLAGFDPPGRSGEGSYHANAMVPRALRSMADELGRGSLAPVCDRLAVLYEQATSRVRGLGMSAWPRQVVHCDFHPGNVVFGGGLVRAVVDFDSCRLGPRVLDVANGALQFSVTRSGLDPSAWPVELDRSRLGAFLRAYDAVEGCIVSRAELEAMPWLMIEALIAESAMPIFATGRFGSIDGGVMLEVVEGKANWIAAASDELCAL